MIGVKKKFTGKDIDTLAELNANLSDATLVDESVVNGKVDKVAGESLTPEKFTTAYKDNVDENSSNRQIVITTAVSITTNTLGSNGRGQKAKNVVLDNGINAINVTVNTSDGFLASYLKKGTGNITFVQGAGRSLIPVDGTSILNGVAGSTASISSVGTIDYLRISNA